MSEEEEPRFAPNGNKLPERLPIGHLLVDTTKTHWIIGPSIGCGGFGDIYLTRKFDEKTDKKLSRDAIVAESKFWKNVIKFEHFSGPLFAEINFYLRVARDETIDQYMLSKKLKHLGMPRFVASGIYDPARPDNTPALFKNTPNINASKPPLKKSNVRKSVGAKNLTNGTHDVGGKPKRIPVSQQTKEKKYRFLVLQRFGDDVHKIWLRANSKFDMTSAFTIALRVIDTLEYIHSHGYVHADVKASNLLINSKLENGSICNGNGCSITRESSVDSGNGSLEVRRTSRRSVKRKLPVSTVEKTNGSSKNGAGDSKNFIEPGDEIYLIDFGLVEKFNTKDGTHREYIEDQRRANNGTVEFSSRDAHIGAFSRRSDLESLAYNLLYWVSGGRLPWCHTLKDHTLVSALKRWYMDNLEVFVNYCFNVDAYPVDAIKLVKGINPVSANGCLSTPVQTTKANGKQQSAQRTNGKRISSSSSKSSATTTSSKTSGSDSIMCAALYDFLSYISKLGFKDEPDYYLLKTMLSNALGVSAARSNRKRISTTSNGQLSKKLSTSPKLPHCENPTPAMREILRKMKMGKK